MAQDLSQTKRDIEAAKAQIATSRGQIAEQRGSLLRAEKEIRYPKKRPKFTPRKTREKQRVFLSEELPTALSGLSQYEEHTLKPYEQQVLGVEAQVKDYEMSQAAYNEARRHFDRGQAGAYVYFMAPEARSDPYIAKVRGYLQEMITQQRLAKAGALKQIEQFRGSLPEGEKLLVQYKNGMPYIAGIESPTLQQSFADPSAYIQQFNKQIDSASRPTYAVKDPITGQVQSVLPGSLPTGSIPVKTTQTGQEAPAMDQFKFRMERPELFPSPASKRLMPVEKTSQAYTYVRRNLFNAGIPFESNWYDKLDTKVFKGLLPGGVRRDVVKQVIKDENEKRRSDIITVKVENPPILADGGEFYLGPKYTEVNMTYGEYLDRMKEVDKQRPSAANWFADFLSQDPRPESIKQREKQYQQDVEERIVKPIQEDYSKKIGNLIYEQNVDKLQSGEITWDDAIKKSEQTIEYKRLEKMYEQDIKRQTGFKQLPRDLKLRYAGNIGLGIYPGNVAEVALMSVLPTAKFYTPTGKLVRGAGIKATAKLAVSRPITGYSNLLYSDILYTPITKTGRFAKASIAAALMPKFVTGAYGAEITKGVITSPEKTVTGLATFIKESPEEFLGFAVGGKLLQRGFALGEYALSKYKAPVTKVNTSYGTVKVLNIPKIGKVAWVEGKYAASEKIAIAKQIYKITGAKIRVFTHVTPTGAMRMSTFKYRKGPGFTVKQVSKPQRGWYEAPLFEFLKRHPEVKTRAGALSYYGELSRDRLIDTPRNIWDYLTGTAKIKKTRTAIQVRRTLKGVDTPTWIKKISEGKKLTATELKTVNKLYSQFFKDPIEFRGKIYVGDAKIAIQKSINLKGKGTPTQLKYYAAMMQYQLNTKTQLPGGPELLSGIAPHGAESQVVTPIGVRFFAKSFKDLRKAYKKGKVASIRDWLTHTERGQARALIDWQLVEIQPVRAFPGRVKVSTKGKTVISNAADVSASLTGATSAGGSLTNSLTNAIKNPFGATEYRPAVREISKPGTFPILGRTDYKVTSFLTQTRPEPEQRRAPIRVDVPRLIPRPVPRPEPRPEPRPTPRPPREPPRDVPRLFPRPEPRPTPRPPREPPRQPPRIIEPPVELFNFDKSKKRKKKGKKVVKKKKKGRGYVLFETGFQATEGAKAPKGYKALPEITGFEILR